MVSGREDLGRRRQSQQPRRRHGGHQIQAGSLVNRASARAVGRLGNNFAFFFQTQRLDHTSLEVKTRGAGVHQSVSLDSTRFFSPELQTLEFQVKVVGQFDPGDDSSHIG